MILSQDDEESKKRRSEAGVRLIAMLEKLHAVQPPITTEEIDAEIATYRAEKKASAHKSDTSK